MRMQQILAFETDLLEYDDLFDGNPAIDAKVAQLKDGARAELAHIDKMGGAVQAIAYMKARLVESNAARIAAIETGQTIVVGVNKWTTGEPSPLVSDTGSALTVDPKAEADQMRRLTEWRSSRDAEAVNAALKQLSDAASSGANVMPPSIACAKAGVTTGEWAAVIRQAFGEYRAPTGVPTNPSNRTEGLDELRDRVDAVSDRLGRRLSFLMSKPGLDGHSNGAEQIAARARDCGMAITYDGIRMTPEDIVARAHETRPHVIGVSILSGSHIALARELLTRLSKEGLGHIPVVAGGIIPDVDADELAKMGIARVYSPKDFELNSIMADLISLAEAMPDTQPVAVA